MTRLFEHMIPGTEWRATSSVKADKLCDGTVDIVITRDTDTCYSIMQHNLSIAETDRLGAALCKDIIDNYRRHAADLKDKIADLENTISDTQRNNTKLQKELGDCRKAFFHLLDERNEYQKTLCTEQADHKDIVTKHTRRIEDLQYKNAELGRITLGHDKVHASVVAGLQLQLADLRDIVRERNHAINNAVVEHNIHSDQLCAKIEELEARNKELEDDVGNIRSINAIHRKNCNFYREDIHKLRETRIADSATIEELRDGNTELKQCANLHNLCFAVDPSRCDNIPTPVYGMRSSNFEMITKGYHGTLSRHGKTIVITLPFEHENVAINAVEYITGHDEHTDNNRKDDDK